MTLVEILTFSVVAGLLVISPGPNGVLIAKTVPNSGRAAGFANVAGFVAAFYLHGALAILGISVILLNSAVAFSIVKYIGAAYLIWIGIKALSAAMHGEVVSDDTVPAKQKRHLGKAFVDGFLTNALNPKVSMFYLAAFPQFIALDQSSASAAFLLVFIHSMINLIWFAVMVVLLAKLTTAASHGSFQRWLKGVTGVVFLGFGAKLALLRP